MKDFLLIEKSDDVGGTWYENSYPGCACDVPAHLYSFSFERNPGWTRMFASQPEIWQYLKACVQRYGLATHLRFRTRFQEAAWDETPGHWRVTACDNVAKTSTSARACWFPAWARCTCRIIRKSQALNDSAALRFIRPRGDPTWI